MPVVLSRCRSSLLFSGVSFHWKAEETRVSPWSWFCCGEREQDKHSECLEIKADVTVWVHLK